MNRVNDPADQVARLAGLGLTADLAAAEAASWRRFVPGPMPWRDVTFYEKEIEGLEARHRAVEAEAAEITSRLQSAPEADMEQLAGWEKAGRRGTRPEPTTPALEEKLAGLQADLLAVRRAVDSVSTDRGAYVEKHRTRLVEGASSAADEALQRVTAALTELESARGELVQARRIELWAMIYPHQAAGREPLWGRLAGGQRGALEPLGLTQAVGVEPVLGALRWDASWVRDAASAEQQQRLAPRAVTQEERERGRDRRMEAEGQMHRQSSQDRRRGELDAMRPRSSRCGAARVAGSHRSLTPPPGGRG